MGPRTGCLPVGPLTQGMNENSHYVLVVTPIEVEISTKTGFFDEMMVLDRSFLEEIGEFLHEVSLWSVTAKELLEDWRAGVASLMRTEMDTLHHAWCAGISRDYLLNGRTALEIQLCFMGTISSSMRNYNQPGRLPKLVHEVQGKVLRYAGQINLGFWLCVLDGLFPAPPVCRGEMTKSAGF